MNPLLVVDDVGALSQCCRHCGAKLSWDGSRHLRDARSGQPHICIQRWRGINEALDHKLGRQANKRSKERAIFHELRVLPEGERTTLQQLGFSLRSVADLIAHMKHAGVPIKSSWRWGAAASKFGLRVRERVYWMVLLVLLSVALIPLAGMAQPSEEHLLNCKDRAILVRLAVLWAEDGLGRDRFHWAGEEDDSPFALETRREVDAVWGQQPAGDADARAMEVFMRCAGTEA